MDCRELNLWLDRRWYDALKKHLDCEPEERLTVSRRNG